ncbi:Imm52 family immunity protein [Pedobacter nyackensis]|uniref:Imm52 family immunity protein n=1 Tax=Pedobacter nyackensis TaxID=475255 RepID=UPI00292EE217|nr:Imm52 family immunity protein [Pedobacter nyackensis]
MGINKIYLYWACNELSLIDRAIDISGYLKSIASFLPVAKLKIADGKKGKEVKMESSSETVSIILEQIKREIRKHYKEKDIPDDFTEKVSSRVSFRSEGLSFRIAIGGCQENASNNIIIEGRNLHLLDVPELFKTSINYFKPDWGVITQIDYIEEELGQTIDEYWFGWMTYFSKTIRLPEIPQNIITEELSTGGKLLITSHEPFNPQIIEHSNKAKALVTAFRKAGMFR